MARRNRITNTLAIGTGGSLPHLTSDAWARVRCEPIPTAVHPSFSSCRRPCRPPSSVVSRGTYLGVNTCE